jgi:acylphosphatase
MNSRCTVRRTPSTQSRATLSMLLEPRALRFVIRGRVQGVAYRVSAQREARRLGLHGWVRNLPDGGVEAYAIGTGQQLAAFSDWLWRGPRLAEVRSVETASSELAPYKRFDVLT